MNKEDSSVTPFGIAKVFALFTMCADLVRSGASPDQFEPTAWYDRVIRIVGGILIFVVFAAGLILMILDRVHH